MNELLDSPQPIAEQIARAAKTCQQQRTGHEPKSVNVMINADTVVITFHGAFSPAEQAMAQTPDGAAKVQEFHRQLFLSASKPLQHEIRRITGMETIEATAEIGTTLGAVVPAFASGTMVQVFLLSHKLPCECFDSESKR